MAEASTSDAIKLSIRAPGDKKLAVTISPSSTVLQLKEAISQLEVYGTTDPCEPATQRLIFSGRVLKDEEKLSTYKIAENHVLHLVRSAKKSEPPPAAAQVPATMGAGQQFANNPLAPLMNASNGNLAGFNPFANMGVNQNDPNFLQNMMQSPEVQNQLNTMMDDPAVLDQIIAASPELRAMGPQARQIMQSPMFRQMMTNPEMMQAAAQMRGGMPGGGGAGGQAPQPGLFGLAQQQQQQQAGGGGGMFGAPQGGQGGNPMAGLEAMLRGTGGGNAGAGGNPMAGMEGLFGPGSPFGQMGAGGMGGFGGQQAPGGFGSYPPPQPQDGRSPEERFETQLQSLRDMGFTNASQNVRALIATGGNVEGAVEYILGGGGM